MSFFKASTKEEDVKASTSSYISTSGIYPVTILAPVVSVSKNGSTSVDFFVDYEGQKQIIYGDLRLTNNDGSDNKIGSKLFNQLLVVAGLDDVSDPVEMNLPIGKKGADKPASVLEDLMDVDVLMRVQLSYSVWKDEIQERRIIRSFFRGEDSASADEVVSGENVGSALEKDKKYEDNITYTDGLTAANVTQWIAENRSGNGGLSGETTKAPNFGKRRFSKK